jgi:hypothetical protein
MNEVIVGSVAEATLILSVYPLHKKRRTYASHSSDRNSRATCEFSLHVFSRQPGSSDDLRVIGIHDHRNCTLPKMNVVTSRICHDERYDIQQALNGVGVVSITGEKGGVRRLSTGNNDGALVRLITKGCV